MGRSAAPGGMGRRGVIGWSGRYPRGHKLTCQPTPVAAFERWVGEERARGAGSREAVEPSAGKRGRGEAVSGEKFAESGQRRAGRRNGIARSGEKRSAGRWARSEAGQRISG